MQRYLILLIFCLGFSQINWEFEIIDSVDYFHSTDLDFRWCSIALDANNIPHIIYYKASKLIHAFPCGSDWQKEIVESGFKYYCFSLIFDFNNTAHLSYYRYDEYLNKFYLCCARRNSTGWLINVVDSINYWPYWYGIYASIDVDTLGHPGIAYVTWNLTDSLCYLKYIHYNGTNWDTSVVEYDSIYVHTQTYVTDWNPSLKFDSKNTPIIAFNQLYYQSIDYDTVKIAYFDDSLSKWIVSPIVWFPPDGQPSLSLELDNQDFPHIALCRLWYLRYVWWDGITWQHLPTEINIGDYGAVIDLKLDSLNNPHIAFKGDFLTPFPNYCYYEDSIWHRYIPFDNDSLLSFGGISMVLDYHSNPHFAYSISKYNGNTNIFGIKYAKGTFVGIEEDRGIANKKMVLEVYPSISNCLLNIESVYQTQDETELAIYDACGAKRKSIKIGRHHPGGYRTTLNLADLPCGTYFAVLKQKNVQVQKKFLLVR